MSPYDGNHMRPGVTRLGWMRTWRRRRGGRHRPFEPSSRASGQVSPTGNPPCATLKGGVKISFPGVVRRAHRRRGPSLEPMLRLCMPQRSSLAFGDVPYLDPGLVKASLIRTEPGRQPDRCGLHPGPPQDKSARQLGSARRLTNQRRRRRSSPVQDSLSLWFGIPSAGPLLLMRTFGC
jgi:hypothetical protein